MKAIKEPVIEFLFYSWNILNILDFLTTYLAFAFAMPIIEGNPLVAPMLKDDLIILDAFIKIGIGYFIVKKGIFDNINLGNYRFLYLYIIFIIYLAVIGNNLGVLYIYRGFIK